MVIINKPGTGSTTSGSGTSTTTTPASNTSTAGTTATAANGIYILGKKVNTTDKTAVKSNVVYVPMRTVGESLGYKVTWVSSTGTMTLTKGNQTLVVLSGKTNGTLNKAAIKLDGAPYLSGGKLYGPMTLFSKHLGYEAAYNSKNNSLSITEKVVATTPPPTTTSDNKPPVTEVPLNAPGIANIVNIAYADDGGFPVVNITSDSALGTYNTYTMTNPNRLVIDIPSSAARTEFSSKQIKQGGIAAVRIGQISNNPAVTRVVLDLDNQKPCKVVQSNDKKTISVLYANVINPIAYQKDGDGDVITVTGTSALDTSYMELQNPRRVVLDVNKAVFDDLLQNISANSSLIKAVRIGQYEVGTARVVLEVTDDAYFNIETKGNTSKIYLSSMPYDFIQYNRYYNTSVLNISPGKDVAHDVSVDQSTNTINVVIPQDLKLEAKRMDINDNLVKYIDYKTDTQNGSKVTTAAIKMQDSVASEVISDASSKLIKIRFKRNITSIQQLTVVIDAGHGGKDPGAGGTDGTTEKSLNLSVALKLDKLLKSMGFNTIMTRKDDTFVELADRANIANTNYADFFMSIHFNSFNKTTNGIETLYYPNTTNADYTLNNKTIADLFHSELLKSTKLGSRGITPRPNLVVLNKTKMPAILAELGFVSNPTELALIKTERYHEDAARGLAVSILKYFRDIQGVNIEIDPNSVYAWPYPEEAAKATTETQPAVAEAIVEAMAAPIQDNVIQP